MSGNYSQNAEQDRCALRRASCAPASDRRRGRRFQGQIEQVLGYVKELGKLNVEGVEPTAHAMPMNNVFRKDETKPCMDREKALANAPLERHGQFVVPKIVE